MLTKTCMIVMSHYSTHDQHNTLKFLQAQQSLTYSVLTSIKILRVRSFQATVQVSKPNGSPCVFGVPQGNGLQKLLV